LAKAKRKPGKSAGTGARKTFDVIVVGGGPAGSVLSWELARRGIAVLLVDRARFPREKVCGDYVEPRGLRLLSAMGCLEELEYTGPLPIIHSATYVNSACRYRGRIPFYGLREDLPPHGYIISREVLDHALLRTAAAAGATIHQQTLVTGVVFEGKTIKLEARKNGRRINLQSRLVIGADGVNSIVARSAGLQANDPRHVALSQRAYAEGLEGEIGEAAFFFEKDFFPGYGWMFPMGGGRVNLGVGVLSETAQRLNIKVPQLFQSFFDKLKRSHHRCANLRLLRPPIGGIVKTYGGAGRNFFDYGLLIGDAGNFVDPMTGEGITPAMESALLAAPVIATALASERLDAGSLSAYESAFRGYFDPSMVFVDFCAATMRNRHFADWWLSAVGRGCEIAQQDADFARSAGACFGGLEIEPISVLWHIWKNVGWEFAGAVPSTLLSMMKGSTGHPLSTAEDWWRWQLGAWNSFIDDPLWHASWLTDLQTKWLHTVALMYKRGGDPRSLGLAQQAALG
jgi:geranylgeranyl reductase family protein